MECRPGCGACCIAISISSPIPGLPPTPTLGQGPAGASVGLGGLPNGKPAGMRCVQLTAGNLCALFGRPERPAICVRFRASEETCGQTAEEALALLAELERLTRPDSAASET